MSTINNNFKPIPLSNSSVEVITASTLALRLELPETIIKELFKKFINNISTILNQLHEYPDDPVQLKMAIHSLKGISKNLFLETLGFLCERFEKDRETLSAEESLKTLEQIHSEAKWMIRQMEQEITG
ncbi:MAG: Hpt domain-containing protein [Campylobacterales bacterium]|nr:Hpt domain-containing protein [Campylobacterales bacterium]